MTDKTERPRCCASVHNDYGVSFHQCFRAGTVNVDGKWYCFQHDPVAVASKKKERHEKWQARFQATMNQYETDKLNAAKAAMFDELVEMLNEVTNGWVAGPSQGVKNEANAILARARKIGEPK